MSLLNFLRPRPQPAAVLTDAIERLQAGIVTNLTLLYSSRLPPAEALLLANCVLSHAMLLEPVGPDAKNYQKDHLDLVRNEAAQLSTKAEVAQAFSYLYAAMTLLLVIRTGNPLPEPAARLGARATELSLYIPNTYDICGSGNALECVQALGTFAHGYLNQALGRGKPVA